MLLLSGFNPPRRCCLPLVVSPLIWSWKGECCQDSNNVMIMGPEEKANTFFFLVGCSFFFLLFLFVCLFWGKHTHHHGQIRWNLSCRSGRGCQGREDSKLPGFQPRFASHHLCGLESQGQNSFKIPVGLGLFSVQIRVLGKSRKLLSKVPAPGLCLPCQGGEDRAFAYRKQIPVHSGTPWERIRNLRKFPSKH